MNKSLLTGLVVVGLAITAVSAYAGYQSIDHGRSAKVLDVEPMSRTIKSPRQVCGNEVVTHRAPIKDPKRVTGTLLGAVAGGLLGNQIGHGDGKTVATVAGAAAGGYAGNQVQENMQQGNTTQSVEQRCRTVYDSVQTPDGYQVRYRLGERQGTVHMNHDPGSSIEVVNGELVLNDAADRS